MTPIEYGSSEAEEEMELADYDSTIPPSQLFKEKIQERVFIAYLSPLFNGKQNLIPLSLL